MKQTTERSGVEVCAWRLASTLVPPSDGALDDSFGSGGEVRISIGDTSFGVNGMGIDREGRIVAAGDAGSEFGFAVARYLSD